MNFSSTLWEVVKDCLTLLSRPRVLVTFSVNWSNLLKIWWFNTTEQYAIVREIFFKKFMVRIHFVLNI